MSKHTEGTLRVCNDQLFDSNGYEVAMTYFHNHKDALHLAACWNALLNIPTGVLEGDTIREVIECAIDEAHGAESIKDKLDQSEKAMKELIEALREDDWKCGCSHCAEELEIILKQAEEKGKE